ncbi:hypothetical protein ZIOFF_068084 [Zingiber officinale]|uniref:Deoxyuridine 5'-triphosphate nucleotidohydrolase n=1 Tax=Zingiber officinale TaxID=94328 RepID=A0A8J5C6K0_ZINOF|nr:hypothetical protein ZIOFF_068084 [Zingiber officinale]
MAATTVAVPGTMVVEGDYQLRKSTKANPVSRSSSRRNLESILQSGLKRMTRLHVHFSSGLPSDGEVISARSSAAWKFDIDIAAGVIDSDYRVEILIMVFNHFDFPFQINQGDCLVQIIFEQLLLPTIYEATSLSPTRSHQGFGLPPTTNKDHYKRHPIWDTLGEPSGKFDYYVNYAPPDPLPDLEFPAPSWDDDTITTTPSILNKLLSREKHLASVCLEDTILQ